MRIGRDDVAAKWTNLLGQRAIAVSDCSKIPEIIVSILEIAAGKDVKEVEDSWEDETALVVSRAISGLAVINDNNDLIEF